MKILRKFLAHYTLNTQAIKAQLLKDDTGGK